MNHKKEQVIILDEDNMLLDDKMIYTSQPKTYPFAVVLRLRVLQVPIIHTNIEKSIQLSCSVIMAVSKALILQRKDIKFCCFVLKREKNNLTNPSFSRWFFVLLPIS